MDNLERIKIIVIAGPTATGKTKLSVSLAKKLNAEIISADSMQIYKHLNIGTAKVTQDEMESIPHHLVDFLEPDILFSVADFVKQAHEKIIEIHKRGKLPIIVGGTGLYISSLINGITFTEEKTDLAIRSSLETELETVGLEVMYQRLLSQDPEYAVKIGMNNQKRVLRALELYQQTGITMTQQIANSKPETLPYDAKLIVLNYSDRKLLYDKINMRIDVMIGNGLLQEVKYVYQNKDKFKTAVQAIGYKELFGYINNEETLENCTNILKQSSRRYAKRQITWFKKITDVNFVLLDKTQDLLNDVLELIK